MWPAEVSSDCTPCSQEKPWAFGRRLLLLSSEVNNDLATKGAVLICPSRQITTELRADDPFIAMRWCWWPGAASWHCCPRFGWGRYTTTALLQGSISTQGLPGSHPTGDLQGALLPRGWAACRREELLLALAALQCSLGVLTAFAFFGVIFHPEASSTLACAPLAWLYSMGLLSKQLKMPFVHLFNGSPLILVRNRIQKPSSFWLASSQPSISAIRALCRVCGYCCLPALTGGLENTGFLAELLFWLKKKKSQSTWLSDSPRVCFISIGKQLTN